MALIKQLYGDAFSFEGSARGKIFNKLESTVKDLNSLKDILRYNGYKQDNEDFPDDPSKTNPSVGISSRYDLEKKEFNILTGGIDCKVLILFNI